MAPVSVPHVQAALKARARLDPAAGAGGRASAYLLNFGQPPRPHTLRIFKLGLPAKHVRRYFAFRLGCHGLPVDKGTFTGIPHDQRLCECCDMGVLGDERHFVFECPILDALRARYAHLFVRDLSLFSFVRQADLASIVMFVSRGLRLVCSSAA